MGDQRLGGAEVLRQRAQPHRVHHPLPRRRATRHLECDHAATRPLLPPSQRGLRKGIEPRVGDPRDARIGLQEPGHGQPVLRVPLHAQRQRLDAAQGEPCLVRRLDGAGGVLHEAQLLDELLVAGQHRAAERGVVPFEVLGGRVHHQVGA